MHVVVVFLGLALTGMAADGRGLGDENAFKIFQKAVWSRLITK